jgi:hypothetical protein
MSTINNELQIEKSILSYLCLVFAENQFLFIGDNIMQQINDCLPVVLPAHLIYLS